ncbi:MAG TPA: LuxR C-terminal-related transcriptional regulator [Bacillota bacterium]|nr:LuxR C-terminal-related transcriptional regulator [Bacillota bacterium]
MKIGFIKFLPGILVIILYNVFGKEILSNGLVYITILLGMEVALIKFIGGASISWVRAFWSVLLVVFSTGIGVLTIETPLMLQPSIARFIIKTPLGVACGSAIEGVFPLISLFLLKTVDISIIPLVKRRIRLLDVVNLFIFAIPFLWLYRDSMRTLKNLETYSPGELIQDIIFQLLLAGSSIIALYWVYTTTRDQRERERRQHEEQLDFEKQQHERDEARILQLECEKRELEKEKDDLSTLYEQVKSSTIDPKVAIDTVQHIIERLQSTVVKQQETYEPEVAPAVEDEDDTPEENVVSADSLVEIHLTQREREVLFLVVQGLYNKQIAERLGIAEGRVNNIINRILMKAKLSGKTQLAVFAVKYGLVNLDDIKIDFNKDDQ